VHHKTVLRVYDVKDKFALARTFRTRRVNVGGVGGGISAFFEPARYETRTETIRRSRQAGDAISPEDSIVEVGDRVEVFTGDVNDIPSSSVWR